MSNEDKLLQPHNFNKGDKVRLTNVASHMYGEECFNEGDTSTVVSVQPFAGVIPAVFVTATKADDEGDFFVVPFAGEDLDILTKIEEE